jgi:AcrR family transcriptional regulator
MARTQSADYEAQRAAILEAAAKAFAETSYPACSMAAVAERSGASKARLYHYYASKEAILVDLLDRYTQTLLDITVQVRDTARRGNLSPQEELAQLIRTFLAEYQTSREKHVALLNDVKFLADAPRGRILARERAVVQALREALLRAYPTRVNAANAQALTMMVFGMINWTFTWLNPDGKISYADYAAHVVSVLERGLQ